MEKTFTDDAFQQDVLQASQPVLVDFWAAWCGPCRAMAPIIEELAKELEGNVIVGKMNVDEHPKAPQQYGIMSIPTFILFKNGQALETIVGGMSKDALKEKIAKHLST